MSEPIRVHQQLPHVVRFDAEDIKTALGDVEGINAKIALMITRSVGVRGHRDDP